MIIVHDTSNHTLGVLMYSIVSLFTDDSSEYFPEGDYQTVGGRERWEYTWLGGWRHHHRQLLSVRSCQRRGWLGVAARQWIPEIASLPECHRRQFIVGKVALVALSRQIMNGSVAACLRTTPMLHSCPTSVCFPFLSVCFCWRQTATHTCLTFKWIAHWSPPHRLPHKVPVRRRVRILSKKPIRSMINLIPCLLRKITLASTLNLIS